MAAVKLSVRNLSKSYTLHPVLDVKELSFGDHGLEGLIGPNGAGKSTLLGLLTRRIAPTTGEIDFETEERTYSLGDCLAHDVARLGLIKTNQRIQNFDSLTIRDSLRLAAVSPARETLRSIFRGDQTDAAVEAEIDSYLAEFPFSDPEGYANSGGEKKLLDILRCLIARPRMLLMDEPTAGLPDDLTQKVMSHVTKKVDAGEMTVVIVEHDLELIWSYCAYVHFLSEGELLFHGPPDKVKENRTVAEKYMGL
ncbi:MAG: ATP-binding cassette domain-containing protein [Pseudomonadota bacterium]